MPLRRFSPGLKAQFAFGMVFLFVQPDASAADISAQQIGGVIIPQAFSQALQDGMSVPLYIHLAGSQGRQDDQRIGRTISESAALLSGWTMDSYASGKYSWKRVKITPVSANKLDSS